MNVQNTNSFQNILFNQVLLLNEMLNFLLSVSLYYYNKQKYWLIIGVI